MLYVLNRFGISPLTDLSPAGTCATSCHDLPITQQQTAAVTAECHYCAMRLCCTERETKCLQFNCKQGRVMQARSCITEQIWIFFFKRAQFHAVKASNTMLF